ncbi:MAG TPA: hypothetical protein VMS08_03980 [Candidatus Saccharimonadia bacterium]|nr:hypothetical protein [Candidatus Saccharimonadia bacterium]
MISSTTTSPSKFQFKKYRSPQTVIASFVARRTVRSATFVALALGAFVASKTVGFADLYPKVHERLVATSLYVNSAGMVAIFGTPHHIEVVASFAAWYALGLGTIIGSIWAYLVATKTLRGNEETGRWEILLAGLTSARRATTNALAGLAVSLVILYAVTAVILVAMGKVSSVGYSVGPALFFTLAAVSGAIIFMAVGALASQLMPTRARAAGLSTVIFGACFLMRVAGDITNAHWLLNITPLGWIEQLQPIYNPQPIWLVPIALFVFALVAASVYLSGLRDEGASIFADHDTAKPKTLLLQGPLSAAVRLSRDATLGWLFGIVALSVFFGLLTKTAATAFNQSAAAANFVSRLDQGATGIGAKTFLGIVFFLLMATLMAYAASAASSIRSDEARGYLDNFLVGPISRLRWLSGRVALALAVTLVAGLLEGAAVWLSLYNQNAGIAIHTVFAAGLNTIAPAVLVLGIGLAALGLIPRLTSVIAYGIIAWSFLAELLSSGLNLNHWVLDTSIFTHVAFAPGTDPKWGSNLTLIIIGLVLAAIGAAVFNNRDLASE